MRACWLHIANFLSPCRGSLCARFDPVACATANSTVPPARSRWRVAIGSTRGPSRTGTACAPEILADCTRRVTVYSPGMKKIISTSEAPAAVGPYSQAVRVGDTIYCAGQIPLDPKSGEIVSGGIEPQTRRVLDNIRAVLNAERLTFANIVKTTVFLMDLGDFQKVNEIYASYFTQQPPARSTVQVAGLPRGARVEIEVIAVAGGGGVASDTSG